MEPRDLSEDLQVYDLIHFTADDDEGPYVITVSTTDEARAYLFHKVMAEGDNEGKMSNRLANLIMKFGVSRVLKFLERMAPSISERRA